MKYIIILLLSVCVCLSGCRATNSPFKQREKGKIRNRNGQVEQKQEQKQQTKDIISGEGIEKVEQNYFSGSGIPVLILSVSGIGLLGFTFWINHKTNKVASMIK